MVTNPHHANAPVKSAVPRHSNSTPSSLLPTSLPAALSPTHRAKRLRRFALFIIKRAKLSSTHFQLITLFFIGACFLVARRQFLLLSRTTSPDRLPHQSIPRFSFARLFTRSLPSPDSIRSNSQTPSILQWPHPQHNFPDEQSPPDPSLYATGQERCFALGYPDSAAPRPAKGHPAAFWQMNSRALCYSAKPICIYGHTMRNLLSFEKRGSSSCHVLSVHDRVVHDAANNGLNESCAAFRNHFIAQMYGREVFRDFDHWNASANANSKTTSTRKPIAWESDFAILIPKYAWSYNICHYNRIWNFVIYVLRNLHLFVPGDVSAIKHVDILFRSGYRYDEHWHSGLRKATIPALQREIGKTISVGKLRYNYRFDFQCIRRGILLGAEGRVDAFPFFNDTPVWRPEQNSDDSHWPVIPHDSIWFRNVILKYGGFPPVANLSANESSPVFRSIPVPPRKIAVLQRSPRSKRRLTMSGKRWLDETLHDLAERYGMKLEYIRTSAGMSLAQQVNKVRDVGIAVGLHGANMVNTMFMPPGGAFFEIFPWRYVRFYYVGGGNSGLRYSYHEPEGGIERHCAFNSSTCFMKYRESLIYLTEKDRLTIQKKLEKTVAYVAELHRRYPNKMIPLRKVGNTYHFDR